MADEPGKRNLGRGLSALLGGAPPEARDDDARSPRSVPIEAVHPGRFQPRRQFPEEALEALAQSVREMLEAGAISAGHGRALIGAVNAEDLARRAVAEDLSVRAGEQPVAGGPSGARRSPGGGSRPARRVDADTAALERTLGERLGLKVVIEHGAGGGTLSVGYKTLEQLDDIVARLSRSATPAS